MPPTDKALAVMTLTEKHLSYLGEARRIAWHNSACDRLSYQHIHDIESLVRYLVDHPERLAGEDEVVVKQEDLKIMREKVMGVKGEDRIDRRRLADIECSIDRWLAGSPTAQQTRGSQRAKC